MNAKKFMECTENMLNSGDDRVYNKIGNLVCELTSTAIKLYSDIIEPTPNVQYLFDPIYTWITDSRSIMNMIENNTDGMMSLSHQHYLNIALFCARNHIKFAYDIGCGYDPIQAVWFEYFKICYDGIDFCGERKSIVEFTKFDKSKLKNFNYAIFNDLKYGERALITSKNIFNQHTSLGMFIYSMNQLIDSNVYKWFNDDTADHILQCTLQDFDIIVVTASDLWDEEKFEYSPASKYYKILHIEKSPLPEEDANDNIRLVYLTKKDNTKYDNLIWND